MLFKIKKRRESNTILRDGGLKLLEDGCRGRSPSHIYYHRNKNKKGRILYCSEHPDADILEITEYPGDIRHDPICHECLKPLDRVVAWDGVDNSLHDRMEGIVDIVERYLRSDEQKRYENRERLAARMMVMRIVGPRYKS
jgi:hypothetical protein